MTISKFREDEDLINVRNEVDRFGFSHFLANKMQIKNPPDLLLIGNMAGIGVI